MLKKLLQYLWDRWLVIFNIWDRAIELIVVVLGVIILLPYSWLMEFIDRKAVDPFGVKFNGFFFLLFLFLAIILTPQTRLIPCFLVLVFGFRMIMSFVSNFIDN